MVGLKVSVGNVAPWTGVRCKTSCDLSHFIKGHVVADHTVKIQFNRVAAVQLDATRTVDLTKIVDELLKKTFDANTVHRCL